MTRAHLAKSMKYAVCGGCERSLCRRDVRTRPGGPPQLVDGRRVPGREEVHELVWGDAWRAVDGHIEMRLLALDRLLERNKPSRRDWTNAERFALSDAVRAYWPAKCPWCGEVNEIDPGKLKVDGVASY